MMLLSSATKSNHRFCKDAGRLDSVNFKTNKLGKPSEDTDPSTCTYNIRLFSSTNITFMVGKTVFIKHETNIHNPH